MSSQQPRAKVGLSLHQRIEAFLATRRAPRGTTTAKVEGVAKTSGEKVWTQLKRWPSLGVVLAGGGALAVASLVGVGELTVAVAVGYGAYQVLREGISPKVAAENVVKEVERA